MTCEEKLKKCMAFAAYLEKMDCSNYDTIDEDGNMLYGVGRYVDVKAISDINDMAWHLMAELAD